MEKYNTKVKIVNFDWDTETPAEISLTNIIELIMSGVSFRLNYDEQKVFFCYDKQKVFFCYNAPKHPEPINAYITMSELERVKKIIEEAKSQ